VRSASGELRAVFRKPSADGLATGNQRSAAVFSAGSTATVRANVTTDAQNGKGACGRCAAEARAACAARGAARVGSRLSGSRRKCSTLNASHESVRVGASSLAGCSG